VNDKLQKPSEPGDTVLKLPYTIMKSGTETCQSNIAIAAKKSELLNQSVPSTSQTGTTVDGG
jgi:hypothetical protein